MKEGLKAHKADIAHKIMSPKSFMSLCKILASIYDYCRELTGDNAYEKYLEHARRHHPDDLLLSRKEFYKQELERKWNGIRRCC